MQLPLLFSGSRELTGCVDWLGKEESAHKSAGGTGCATPQGPAKTQRGFEGEGREESEVLGPRHGISEVTALAGSIWVPTGGK